MSPPDNKPRTLTEADLQSIRDVLVCRECQFTYEEVQFVRDWMDTMKQAKSEVVKFIVRGCLFLFGAGTAIYAFVKLGFHNK